MTFQKDYQCEFFKRATFFGNNTKLQRISSFDRLEKTAGERAIKSNL